MRLLCAALLLLGCGSTEEAAEAPLAPDAALEPAACNPVAPDWDCLLPWPSDAFRTVDGVRYPPQVLPVDKRGVPADPTRDAPTDGFPVTPQILVALPGADPDELVFLEPDATASLRPESTTLILEASTGAPVLHFAEAAPLDPDVVALRPLRPLQPGTRYVVVIQGLSGVEAPESGRARLEVLESTLQLAGVAPEGVQLIWDFTTRSHEVATGRLRAIRDATLGVVPAITIDSIEGRRIEGTIEVPRFVDSEEAGARLLDEGSEGTVQIPFVAMAPTSALEGTPARLLLYGHGFFGDRNRTLGYPADFAERFGFLIVGLDFQGMATADVNDVIPSIAMDPSGGIGFAERVHQGLANFIAMARAGKGALAEALEAEHGAPLYDPAEGVWYLGISAGHMLGGTLLGLSPDFDGAVLNVGGAGFTLVASRARPFAPFITVIANNFEAPRDRLKYEVLIQHPLDRIDPASYAIEARPPVLMQVGLGDAQVPNVASHLHARGLGLGLVQPAPRALAGFEDAPSDEEGLVEYDLGLEAPLPGTVAGTNQAANDVHEGVRRVEAAMKQMDAFLRVGGRVMNFCSGVCDPD